MIPNQWYAILDSKEVKAGKPVGVTRMGEKLVAWREQGGPGDGDARSLSAPRRGAQRRRAARGLHHVSVPRVRI